MEITMDTPKPKYATAILSLVGNATGLYLAYKNKKSFWGYAGYFLLGGLSGSVVGYSVDYTLSSLKGMQKSTEDTKPESTKLTIEQAKELAKKLTPLPVMGGVRNPAIEAKQKEAAENNKPILKQLIDSGWVARYNNNTKQFDIGVPMIR